MADRQIDVNKVIDALKNQIGSLTVELTVANLAIEEQQEEIARLTAEHGEAQDVAALPQAG